MSAIFLALYFIPVYFQAIQGYTAIEAGVRLLPFVCVVIFSVLVSGALLGKTGLYMPWYTAGSALMIIGAALLHTLGVGTTAAHVMGFSVILGAGGGSFCQASFAVAQSKVSRAEVPVAVAFIGCA